MQQAAASRRRPSARMTPAAVFSDLAGLVEHVQNSLRLIERTIATETSPETSPGSSGSSTNVIAREKCQLQGYLIGRPEPIAHYRHLVAGLAGACENIVGAR
jgi:hypothetical protein